MSSIQNKEKEIEKYKATDGIIHTGENMETVSLFCKKQGMVQYNILYTIFPGYYTKVVWKVRAKMKTT